MFFEDLERSSVRQPPSRKHSRDGASLNYIALNLSFVGLFPHTVVSAFRNSARLQKITALKCKSGRKPAVFLSSFTFERLSLAVSFKPGLSFLAGRKVETWLLVLLSLPSYLPHVFCLTLVFPTFLCSTSPMPQFFPHFLFFFRFGASASDRAARSESPDFFCCS